MKRCPECRRDYYDDSLLYCLEDGTALLQGNVASPVDSPTAILHSTDAPVEAATRAQIHTTDQTMVMQSGITDVPSAKGFDKRLLLAPVALAVIVLVGFFSYRYFATTGQIESIAVMPFVNGSGNADIEYLSDGMTETLIKSLSTLPNLDVRPSSAVFRYKGKETDLSTIAKELNVQAILTGRVIQRGDQLTLRLELVDAAKNRVIWAEQYQKPPTDIVSLQSEIAKDVSSKLSPQISGADETKVAKQATTDPAAYQAYLRGRYHWNKRTGEEMNKAIEQFQIAIGRDPNYALAYAGLADTYSLLPDYAQNAPTDSFTRAAELARKAIALDPQLADPHATLGNLHYYDAHWAESEAEYKRAIELNPNYATAYHWYSVLLYSLGRNEEAAAMILRAHEIDPLSSIINQNIAQMFRMKGDHKAAIEVCQKIIDLDPNFPGGHFAMAWSFLKLGRNDEAIAEFQKAADFSGRHSASLSELGAAYAASGKVKEAQALITELEARFTQNQAKGRDVATIYAYLGNKDKAFEWLEKDIPVRAAYLAEFRWSPGSEPLRDDPRFKDLLKQTGVPQ